MAEPLLPIRRFSFLAGYSSIDTRTEHLMGKRHGQPNGRQNSVCNRSQALWVETQQIIVLENGEIIEQDDYNTLIEKGQILRPLCRSVWAELKRETRFKFAI